MDDNIHEAHGQDAGQLVGTGGTMRGDARGLAARLGVTVPIGEALGQLGEDDSHQLARASLATAACHSARICGAAREPTWMLGVPIPVNCSEIKGTSKYHDPKLKDGGCRPRIGSHARIVGGSLASR
jgi:hypothetical protein